MKRPYCDIIVKLVQNVDDDYKQRLINFGWRLMCKKVS